MSILTKLAIGAVAVAAIAKSKILNKPAAKKARTTIAAKAKKAVKAAKPAARTAAKKVRHAASSGRKATTHARHGHA